MAVVKRLFLYLCFVLPILLIAVGLGAMWVMDQVERPGPLAEEKSLIIPRGAGVAAIAAQLESEGVVDDAMVFRAGVRLAKASRALRAGEFAFPAGVSVEAAIEILRSGETVVHRLTVPEGLTSREIVALVKGAELLSGEIAELPAEGSLLPDTYHFARGDDRGELVARMHLAQADLLAAIWKERAENLPISSPEEAIILASIVEKETGLAEERGLVAGVFINRLNKKMRLQSDPTVVYGVTMGKAPLGRPLSRKDLKTDTPYNTYTIPGLPPGPIANPGRAALEAVLQPTKTDHLYFVADGSGGHAFAKTLAQHNRNVAKWRKLQKQKKQAAGAGAE